MVSIGGFICAFALLGFSAQAEEPGCAPSFVEQLGHVEQLLGERKLKEARETIGTLRASLPVECPFAELRLDVREALLLLDEGRLADTTELIGRLKVPPQAPQKLKNDLLYAKATVSYDLGQHRRARRSYEKLLELDRAAGKPRQVALDLYMIAATYVGEAAGEEDREAATEQYRDALAKAEEVEGAEMIPLFYTQLGKLVGGAEGSVFCKRALALASDPGDEVAALGALAVERLKDNPAEAIALLERAQETAQKAWDDEGNPWPLLDLWNDRLPVRWATLPRDEALADSEAVLDHIEAVRQQQEDPATQAGLFSVWTEVYQWLAGRLLEAADGSPPREDLVRAFDIMERYRARVLVDSLTKSGATVEDQDYFASLDEVAASLAEDEALLAFQMAPWKDVYGRFAGGSWLISVSRQGARAYGLHNGGPLARKVRMYLGLLAKRGAHEDAAARLYQDLLEPALADLPDRIDKLILVPDGELHLLPFGALRAVSDGPSLADRYQLSSVPSATLWHRWRSNGSPPRAAAALVMADPLPGGTQQTAHRDALGPLPGAAEEGRAVVERVGRGSLLRLGEDASEAFFKAADLGRFDIVHLAAHGVVNEVHPELSAVHLAPGDGEDGELRASEIVELDLEGTIVVLSACQSASGGVLRGEGVMSLARAFFQAGASTVVGSLWFLDDQETRQLFDAFYRHLAQGRSVRDALHRAQSELRAAGAPPAAWAGVIVLGDGARVPLPAKLSLPAVAGVVLVVLILVLLLARRRGSDTGVV